MVRGLRAGLNLSTLGCCVSGHSKRLGDGIADWEVHGVFLHPLQFTSLHRTFIFSSGAALETCRSFFPWSLTIFNVFIYRGMCKESRVLSTSNTQLPKPRTLRVSIQISTVPLK